MKIPWNELVKPSGYHLNIKKPLKNNHKTDFVFKWVKTIVINVMILLISNKRVSQTFS